MADDVTQVNFNPDKITLDDLEVLEEAFGMTMGSIGSLLQGGTIEITDMTAKMMKGLAFLAARQVDPEITADAIGRMTMGDLTATLTAPSRSAVDPTEGESSPTSA